MSFNLQTGLTSDPERAWAPYTPDPARPWDLPLAGHLLRRAAFGANWGQLQRALDEGPQQTVDRLLRPEGDLAAFQGEYDDYEQAASGGDSTDAVRAWWLRRMIETPHPLQERMTLFWHDFLGISGSRVKSPRLMATHIQTLRGACLGGYEDLLGRMAQDPAVFLGLDAARNRKARPNEHLARQFLDRYGVGQENYDQQDIRDVARAFTGWTVLRNQLRFFERERDDGQKTILGERGNWNSADAVRIIVRQRATAISLSRALFRWLVSETDDPGTDLLRPLVEKLSSGGDIGDVVETILRSNLFYSPAAYRQRVKSPVEFAVGMIRGLEANVATKPLGDDLARLGQNLYHPPTIRGWAGGRHWINAAAMAGRENLVTALLVPSGRYGAQVDVPALVREHGCTDVPSAGSFLLDLFLQGDVSDAPPDGLFQASGVAGFDRQVRSLAQWVVTRPEFQLA